MKADGQSRGTPAETLGPRVPELGAAAGSGFRMRRVIERVKVVAPFGDGRSVFDALLREFPTADGWRVIYAGARRITPWSSDLEMLEVEAERDI